MSLQLFILTGQIGHLEVRTCMLVYETLSIVDAVRGTKEARRVAGGGGSRSGLARRGADSH